MREDKDWRLVNQEKWLKGVTLHRRAYGTHPADKNWDHDHCDFCWAKFALVDDPTVLKEGYTTEDEYHWILCPKCFEDFKERFQWTVVEHTR